MVARAGVNQKEELRKEGKRGLVPLAYSVAPVFIQPLQCALR